MKSTKRLKPSKGKKIPIALDCPIVKENLSLEYVHYPNLYGTFFGFSKEKNSQIFFCNCSKPAIENYLNLNVYELSATYEDVRITSKLSSHFFPNSIASLALKNDYRKIINYKNKICHRCNMTTPTLRYCHEMYGGNFKQLYGWYINQTSLRLGIRKLNYLKEIAPDDLIEKIEKLKELDDKRLLLITPPNDIFLNQKQVRALDKERGKIKRSITREIESLTRLDFGFRKIGDGNVSETILYKIVKSIFPKLKILRNHRPKWLEGLELDIFLPDINIGIEYQGQQHFHPVAAWGGVKALEKLQERDLKKKKLCKEFGIKLIEIDYTEPLEINYVKEKICA